MIKEKCLDLDTLIAETINKKLKELK